MSKNDKILESLKYIILIVAVVAIWYVIFKAVF